MKQAMFTHLVDSENGRFIKAIYSNNVRDSSADSSLLLLFTLGVVNSDNPILQRTIDYLEKKLWIKSKVGGIARHENDGFQKTNDQFTGNPWIISTLWFARWKIDQATTLTELKNALNLLNWAKQHSTTSGILSEQINPINGKQISVSPLIWSHAEYIIALNKFMEKYQSLKSK